MDAVTIGKLHSRYLLPASAGSQRDRLDCVIQEATDHYLELALARTGVSMDGEVCIRSVRSVARVHLSSPDSALAAAWSVAVAEAVSQAISNSSLDVIRYRSRNHALLDLVAGATTGEFSRSWAWRQMGLWQAGETSDQAIAVQEAMRALCSESRAAVQVLATLARSNDHAGALAWLIIRASGDQWLALARAVLGVTTPSAAAILHQDTEVPASGAHMRLAHSILEHSAIARRALALFARHRIAPPVTLALAVLAIAEIEPSALCTIAPAVRELVSAVAVALGSPAHVVSRSAPPKAVKEPSNGKTTASGVENAELSNALIARGETSGERAVSAHRREPVRVAVQKPVGPHAIEEPGSSTPEQYAIPDPRTDAKTRAGGLLFFVLLADRLGLHNQLSDRLPGWSLRFVLHRLAAILAPVEADDAAALAFAGLAPNSTPPSQTEEPLSDEGLTVIAASRAHLILALRNRLAQRPHTEALLALDDDALSEFVWRRDARVLADPGWLEIRFSLDDVSTEIRAAGLDLDPGWVPWLGVVMRFVYV